MHALTPTGSISSLVASVRTLGERILTLVTLEGRQAGLSLAGMLGLAIVAAALAIIGWISLLACFVLTLVQKNIVGWGWALSIAALLSFAGVGALVLMVIHLSNNLLFPATRRQVRQMLDGDRPT